MIAIVIAALQLSAIQGPWCTQQQEASDDPILNLDADYVRESNAIRNDTNVDRSAFYESWLAKFRQVINENPKSKSINWGRGRIIELLNGLERYRESIELLEVDLREASSQQQRIQPNYQIAELARAAYFVEKDPALARKSIDSFRKVRNALPNPRPSGIVALAREGELESNVFGNHMIAAESFLLANEWLPKLTDNQRAELGTWPNAEQLLGDAMIAFAKAAKPDRAFDLLKQLDLLQGRRFSTAHYLILLTRVDLSEAGDEYRKFAEIWVRQHGDDPMAFDLTYELAFQYRDRVDPSKAIKLYEHLLENYSQADLDPTRMKAQLNAKKYLHGLYLAAGQSEKAATLAP